MKNDSIKEMSKAVQKITKDRDWEKFHTPKNLAMSLSKEATEVLEHFIWDENEIIINDEKRKKEIAHELADVLHSLLLLSNLLKIDLVKNFWGKLEIISKRYPAEKIYGINSYQFKNRGKRRNDKNR
jgi:dCTP diphosphatase